MQYTVSKVEYKKVQKEGQKRKRSVIIRTRMLKVIFLDLDGVLNSFDNMRAMTVLSEDRSMDQWHFHYFDERCVRWLRYILKETGAKIVVSSTWRSNPSFTNMWESRHMPDVIIGETPRSAHAFRGIEIRTWMESYGLDKIFSYLIIDDDRDMLPEHKPHFVHVKGDTGLTMVEARKGIQILNHPPQPDQWLFRSPDL